MRHGLCGRADCDAGPAGSRARVPRPVAPVEEVAVPEPAEVETVSLEEADAEAQGKKPATAEPGAEEEEVEIDETLDDDTFIEEQEEEDADVTDIIGGDIEPKRKDNQQSAISKREAEQLPRPRLPSPDV